jgi:thiamine pyrophosphate-dependent acetolactate synthase large subunit-like protein
MTAGQVVARTLIRHGVKVVFGIPGVHTMEIYRALAESQIRHVTPRHEQGAVFMADGYARASGRPGVACVITGPGLANGATAIAAAYSDSIPVIVLTTQIARDLVGRGRRLSHELVDQASVVAGITTSYAQPSEPREIERAIRAAFAQFSNERPVPAVIEIPVDVLDQSDDVVIGDPTPQTDHLPVVQDLRLALAWLEASSSPVVIVGGGAQQASAMVVRLVERLGAVVVSTSAGKGVVPADHPQFVASGLDLQTVRGAVGHADLVLIIGSELGSMDTYRLESWPLPPRSIQIDIVSEQVGRNAAPSLALIGDAQTTVTWLTDHLGQEPSRSGRNRAAELRSAAKAEALRIAGDLAPWITALQRGLPRDAILSVDITRPVTYAALYLFRCHAPRTWLRPLGLTTLGYALPAAIGARMAMPNRAVVALAGDGGFMFTMQEFLVAAELGLNLPVIVWNDRSYGEIRDKMVSASIPPLGTDLHSPDFVALGAALGGHGCSVRTPAELTRAVRLALQRSLPTLIEVVAWR